MRTFNRACLTFAAMMTASCSQAEPDPRAATRGSAHASVPADNPHRSGVHLKVDHRIADILTHPAFAGHARLILPWDNRGYDEQMPLRRIGSLL